MGDETGALAGQAKKEIPKLLATLKDIFPDRTRRKNGAGRRKGESLGKMPFPPKFLIQPHHFQSWGGAGWVP